MTPKRLVALLDELGWFDGLPSSERLAVQRRAEGLALSSPEDVASAVASVTFEPEGVCDPESYRSLLREILGQIPGGLKAEAIETSESEDEPGEMTVTLVIGGRRYTAIFDQDDDWAHEAVLELVEGALVDRGSPLRLFALPVDEQRVHLAVCTEAAFERASDARLFPHEEDAAEPAAASEEGDDEPSGAGLVH